ncbi:MAG: isopropylmalate isomerase [Synechococcaceae bacterium WB6_3B_236]|nr:isopropylmalate isomerase [Synechococcaceae bacterium WB6_3B_236]
MTNPAFPLGPIPSVSGSAVVLRGDDIDTDRIIPARFLKCVSFDGLGAHPFDRPAHQGASILLANRNFGCGSSREHAPQALMRWGIRAIVAESYAEIFFGNCLALGIPCLGAGHSLMLAIQAAAAAQPNLQFQLDVGAAKLQAQLSDGEHSWPLELGAGPRQMLLSGQWNGTAQLVGNGAALQATAARLPYLGF